MAWLCRKALLVGQPGVMRLDGGKLEAFIPGFARGGIRTKSLPELLEEEDAVMTGLLSGYK